MRKDDTNNLLRIYYCGQEQCSPGHFWGTAVRPHYLLHVILKGEGYFEYKNKEYHLKAGDVFFLLNRWNSLLPRFQRKSLGICLGGI